MGGWLGVTAVNLPVPLVLASSIAVGNARLGMALAAIPFVAVGFWICQLGQFRAKPFFIGAGLVAVSQCLPLLQIMAGLVALTVAESVEKAIFTNSSPGSFQEGELTTVIGGFVATIMTGGQLMLVSALLGYSIRFLTPERWWQEA